MKFLVLVLFAAPLLAQPVFTDVFPPAEYAARRAAVMAAIGDGARSILQGTTERPGEQPLRQSNQFHYLTGVVEPRALLIVDGRTHRSTLFLNPRNERREKAMFGPGLYPGEEAVRATGIEAVLPRDDFRAALAALAAENRALYPSSAPRCWAAPRLPTRPPWPAHQNRSMGWPLLPRRAPSSNT